MSEATTGVAQAKARVIVMPKLSLPRDGATRNFAAASSSVSFASSTKPRMSIPSSEIRSRASSRRTASGSAPSTRRRSPLSRRRGQARSSTGSPFRGSWRPAKTMRSSRFPGSISPGISTPLGITS